MSARKPMLATDRAALMLQLVPYLIGKGEVSIAEAAEEFEVTPEQMRAMVERLTVIGLPGEGGFWQLPNELFDIDWDLLDSQDVISITNTVGLERSPRLTAREAAALLAGLQLARTLPGVGTNELVNGLLAKLARGASATPADVIVAPGPVDGVRDVVDEALRRRVAVSFTYKAPDAPATTRTVDPVKVHIASGQWYLQGWCHMREAMRTFHLERASGFTLTDIPITHGAEPVPALFEPGENDVVARIRFPAALAPLLGDYLDRAATQKAGSVMSATLHVADEHSLKRLAARRGGDVEILDPPAARCAAAAWAQAGLAQYRGEG
ncbi:MULTISPECIES: helix-turn-helix transcriptional regulator [Microbacterium]|uniref:WYL domain-containing transcriptional regulator n=1 Tax=Microbacterium wangchenii TaxID=2541726 RepID=A0ABX5SR92_9MICO|nr:MULTISPECIES: WYL domain-containing protein [Microbacterium]MCK6065201.1 WYL domain-containing protein [Microbacterium sp. EYE_512]QBR88653.1 WYL domain-containing transcriptional regulator [Microbacterium wangchenii]TFV82292.1 WYL domain-containing transcriptional regulator [Microbacterium sp. dk485]TXK20378.1 WYL domain-containing protein [Microbacterium wangchenii]